MTSPEEWPWRVGTHYNIHVYAVNPAGDRADDIPVGTFMTPELAAAAVYSHNRLLRLNVGHTDAEWQALGEAVERVREAAFLASPQLQESLGQMHRGEVVELEIPQWEHGRKCINDDCEGCTDQ